VKANTAIGIGVGFAGLLMGAMMEGTSPAAFFNISALLIILGGTGGVTLAGTSLAQFKKIPSLYKIAMSPPELNMLGRVRLLVNFAEMARREGLLALDDELQNVDDEFTRKGMQLVVDGTDPELVREILDIEMDAMAARHALGAQPFEKAGGFAPTMGIIGTVMGLVHVLENLSRPATLGPAISSAFIATLYGVGSANVIFLPIANKLKYLSSLEQELRMMTLEGILAIQAGDNPRIVESKLMSYVSPDLRTAEGEAEAGSTAAAAAEPAAAAA
jgi:chemotaxis protein MotA